MVPRVLSTAAFAVLVAACTSAEAAVLVNYNFSGAAGNQVSQPVNTKDGNVTASAITRGTGLTPAAAGDCISSSGWTTNATAIDANDYYEFSITPAAGRALNLDSLRYGERRSSTGPNGIDVRSSLDGYVSSLTPLYTPSTSASSRTINLGTAFDAVAGPVTFRIYGYGAGSAAGSYRLENATVGGLNIDGSTFVLNTSPVAVSLPAAVTFGSVVSGGAPFSATVTATDLNLTDVLSLSLGSIPTGITAVSVSGGGTSPATFTVSGLVDYSLNGQTVFIPYTVADGAGGTATGNISLVVTPEPAALCALGSVASLLLRRRK